MQEREIKKRKKAYDTRYSQAVTHLSTNRALRCLTSVIGREPVFSTWYGRRHQYIKHQHIYTAFATYTKIKPKQTRTPQQFVKIIPQTSQAKGLARLVCDHTNTLHQGERIKFFLLFALLDDISTPYSFCNKAEGRDRYRPSLLPCLYDVAEGVVSRYVIY